MGLLTVQKALSKFVTLDDKQTKRKFDNIFGNYYANVNKRFIFFVYIHARRKTAVQNKCRNL